MAYLFENCETMSDYFALLRQHQAGAPYLIHESMLGDGFTEQGARAAVDYLASKNFNIAYGMPTQPQDEPFRPIELEGAKIAALMAQLPAE